MLMCSRQRVSRSAALVVELLSSMDVDGDGHVTLTEFMERAMDQPKILQALAR